MKTYPASKTRVKLISLINKISKTHQPILITNKKANTILISREDWKAIQETLHILSKPMLAKSIKNGLKTPLQKCAKKVF